MVKILTLEEEIRELEKERDEIRQEICKVIYSLPDPQEQEALSLLYPLDKKWKDAADEMGCSIKQLGEYRNAGLDSLSSTIGGGKNDVSGTGK